MDHFLSAGVLSPPKPLLSNSSGAYGVAISEHSVMVALEMLRRQTDYTEIVRRREWIRDLPVQSLRDSRITLLGTGDIGREAALRLRAFGPRCLLGVNRGGSNPRGLFDRVLPVGKLDTALILSLPGTAETRGLLDARRLDLLPDQALLINVGRGSAVDLPALESRLRAGRLRAALDCPNLLITPHVAGNMTLPWTRERIVALFLEDLENYCAGKPLIRQIDFRRGY